MNRYGPGPVARESRPISVVPAKAIPHDTRLEQTFGDPDAGQSCQRRGMDADRFRV